MKNFKNATIIILIVALFGVLYMSFLHKKQGNIPINTTMSEQKMFDMKQKCRIIGEEKKKDYEDNSVFFNDLNYTYNEELNTCLLYAYSYDYWDKNWVREKFITDLSTGKDIVYFFENSLGEQNTQIFCDTGFVCVSEEDFDNRKKELFK